MSHFVAGGAEKLNAATKLGMEAVGFVAGCGVGGCRATIVSLFVAGGTEKLDAATKLGMRDAGFVAGCGFGRCHATIVSKRFPAMNFHLSKLEWVNPQCKNQD